MTNVENRSGDHVIPSSLVIRHPSFRALKRSPYDFLVAGARD